MMRAYLPYVVIVAVCIALWVYVPALAVVAALAVTLWAILDR
jgi:hypothetical protein